MAIIKRISSRAKVGKIVDYLKDKEKTEEKLISGKDCYVDSVKKDFALTKELYNKTNGVQYHHIIQSFSPQDNIIPEKAHELGKEFAESQFKGHEVFIVTHKDKDHIHNHLVVNSVSFEHGKKYQASNKSLWDLKRESNKLCERENLKTLDLERKSLARVTSAELRMSLRGQIPWKDELRECIDFAKERTKDIDEFRKYLKDNFEVETRLTNKTISYKHPERVKSIRGNRLGQNYDKGELENEFIRKEKAVIREGERDPSAAKGNSRESEVTRSTPNVDWSAIRNNVKGKGNRVSKQLSDDVIGEIQRKVHGVKERTDRATGEGKRENRQVQKVQRDIERESKESNREPKSKHRERDFDFER